MPFNSRGILVTAVGAPPGLNALRALVESGHNNLFASDMNPTVPGLYQFGSRVRPVYLPSAGNEPLYLEELEGTIRKHAIRVILPCIEEEILLISKHRRRIESLGAVCLIPDALIVSRAADKGRAHAAALSAGLPTPQSIRMELNGNEETKLSDLLQWQNQCPPPWIVKPCLGHGMRGIFKVHSVEEAVKKLAQARAPMLVQEYIPGKAGSMHLAGLLYDGSGKLRRSFTSRSISTLYPEGGPATAGVSIFEPELVSMSTRLIQEIGGWRGPVNVEWIRDPRNGRFLLMEVNPRLWGYGYLAVAAGISFPDLTVRLAFGEEIGEDPGFRCGVTLMRSTQDLIFETCPIPGAMLNPSPGD